MENGALPVPQGLMALLGGLVSARQIVGETTANHGFNELLAEILADGALTPGDLDGAAMPQALLPLLGATAGNTLPPQTDDGAPGDDAAADLETLLALLGIPSPAPSQVAGGPAAPAAGAPGQGLGPLPAPQGPLDMLPVALSGEERHSDAAKAGAGPTLAAAAGGSDKIAVLSLQSLPTPPPAAATPGQGAEALTFGESASPQNQGATRAPEQAVPPPLRPVDGLTAGTPIQTPVGRPEWAHELGQRVLWMTAGHGSQQAELKLNPPQLGPLEVRVVVRNEEVSVFFNSNHAVTREALEQALPRLREMFAANGVALAEANVSGGRDDGDNGTARGDDRDGPRSRDADALLPQGGEGEADGPYHGKAGLPRGLVDTYV